LLNGCFLLPGAEFYVAVDNRGLWPNLKLLSNNEIGAVAYNLPAHGGGPGNVDLWVSSDGGKLWKWRSTVSDHSDEPNDMRINHAAGINSKGEYIVLVGGWKNCGHLHLPIQVCISKDYGYTWSRHETQINGQPFGDIVLSPNGILTCGIGKVGQAENNIEYKKIFRLSKRFPVPPSQILITSRDNGETWGNERVLSTLMDEAALLRCKNGKWLATLRTASKLSEMRFLPGGGGGFLQLFKSMDEGKSWSEPIQISVNGQAPSNLLELKDGNILLTYGSRTEGLFGVIARLSKDAGESWSKPYTLISVPNEVDCGYPSSVQLEDGTIVTAYYMGPKIAAGSVVPSIPWHCRYHMGVARWRIENLGNIIYPVPG
jgi:hypothetical protein